MDGVSTTLLCGLIVSHVYLYYKIGRLEQYVKDINASVSKAKIIKVR